MKKCAYEESRSAARVGDVENRFIDQRLRRQSSGGEKELFVRVSLAVDSGVYGGPPFVESYVRVKAEGERGEEVRAFVGKKARAGADRESLPVVVGGSGWIIG